MKQTALIIEDDENNMELIAFILERYGYGTIKAWTGQQGIERALTGQANFIVLDIQLPDMDGEQVLHAIRHSELDWKIPVIAMTSYAMAGDRERLLAAGCDGYIEKPIDPQQVMTHIQRIIEKSSGDNSNHRP